MFDRNQFDPQSPSLGYATQTSDSVSQYAIPTAVGDERLPVVTATLELMAYYAEKWVTPAYYESILGPDYNRDPRVPEMLHLIEKGHYTDFAFVWSHSLGDITWKMRMHFTENRKIQGNLKNWDQNATALLNEKLLPQLEKTFNKQ